MVGCDGRCGACGGDYAIMIETETENGEKETLKADLHVVDASLPPQKLLLTEWFL